MHKLKAWHYRCLSPSHSNLFHNNILYPKQNQLWKLAAASPPGLYWRDISLVISLVSVVLFVIVPSMLKPVSIPILHAHVLTFGALSFNFTINSIGCYTYRLYTYINNSLDFSKKTSHSLVLHAWPSFGCLLTLPKNGNTPQKKGSY